MYWSEAWKLGASMWANSVALSETLLAANAVVGKRSRTIDAAMRNPLAADIGELGRMLPEKMAAFGNAGQAIARDWATMHEDMLAQGRDMMSLYTSGWPPNMTTLARMTERNARLTLQMSMAGGRALAPIHRTATANDRRLKKRS